MSKVLRWEWPREGWQAELVDGNRHIFAGFRRTPHAGIVTKAWGATGLFAHLTTPEAMRFCEHWLETNGFTIERPSHGWEGEAP